MDQSVSWKGGRSVDLRVLVHVLLVFWTVSAPRTMRDRIVGDIASVAPKCLSGSDVSDFVCRSVILLLVEAARRPPPTALCLQPDNILTDTVKGVAGAWICAGARDSRSFGILRLGPQTILQFLVQS